MNMNYSVEETNGAELLAESNGCSVYRLRNEGGEGIITLYQLFPGVCLGFNDFHMQYYDSQFVPGQDMFCIDHCREGRMECPASEEAYSYVEAGDIKLDRRLSHEGRFEIPLKHYHGAMVCVDLNVACDSIKQEMKDFPVDLKNLQQKFCSGIYPMVLHGEKAFEHIFSEIYAVPHKIKIPYFKIKVLELLLYLDAMELPEKPMGKPYFYKTQVEKVKAIQEFISLHMDENFTQEELAEKFDISLTTMKQCFKSVYGSTIATWLLQYRMNYAAVQLKSDKEQSIADLAGMVGYDSPSKFAIAFRKVMGMSPTEYRERQHL